MKSLKISIANARCTKVNGKYKSFDIKNLNEIGLEALVAENLPEEIEDYEFFIADINIQIDIKPLQLNINKTGYMEEVGHEEECASGNQSQDQRQVEELSK